MRCLRKAGPWVVDEGLMPCGSGDSAGVEGTSYNIPGVCSTYNL